MLFPGDVQVVDIIKESVPKALKIRPIFDSEKSFQFMFYLSVKTATKIKTMVNIIIHLAVGFSTVSLDIGFIG